ncbi:Outer membrane lipoprotein Blc precursor [Marinomonas aquimarina]|uniref:Outer membrane lipoprotein Blc n=1 Tax=Marinomonas aquimarina TaxID=295068 RepID=A0A1A8TBR5_9GAMM|nr:lipocalin family protein [Marinomonas aquimarina]SBS30425.1 Outer membrane lipoprotein Blc precursor [Marinomonas aquimarina]
MLRRLRYFLFAVVSLTSLTACSVSAPKGIQPVTQFELTDYLGTWYEIARLDHSFEQGLSNVTAQYSLREDGGVKVINRGYAKEEQAWQEAEGKAYFVQDSATGHLKVSFFGPFYGAYVIFNLDQAYQYSLVSGPDRSYFWLLSRTPSLTPEKQAELIAKAKAAGFATEQLIFVDQTLNHE